MTPQEKAHWAERRMNLRRKIMDILRKIETGEYTALEFAQLWNYTATSLMLLSKVNEKTWETVIKETEIAAWMNDEVEDWEVYTDK